MQMQGTSARRQHLGLSIKEPLTRHLQESHVRDGTATLLMICVKLALILLIFLMKQWMMLPTTAAILTQCLVDPGATQLILIFAGNIAVYRDVVSTLCEVAGFQREICLICPILDISTKETLLCSPSSPPAIKHNCFY